MLRWARHLLGFVQFFNRRCGVRKTAALRRWAQGCAYCVAAGARSARASRRAIRLPMVERVNPSCLAAAVNEPLLRNKGRHIVEIVEFHKFFLRRSGIYARQIQVNLKRRASMPRPHLVFLARDWGSTIPGIKQIYFILCKTHHWAKMAALETRTPAKPSRFRPPQPDKLTLGLIAPFKGYPDGPCQNGRLRHRDKAADQSGIAALMGARCAVLRPEFWRCRADLRPVGNAGLSRRAHPKRCARLGGLCFAPARADSHRQRSRIGGTNQRRPLPLQLGQRRPSHRDTRLCRRFQQPRRTLPRSVADHPPPDAGKIPPRSIANTTADSAAIWTWCPKPAHGLPMLA